MKRLGFVGLRLGLLAVFATATAGADDVGSMLEVLEENVVSGASRSAERASDAPATSSTITAEELRRYGIRRLDEALNFLSLGMFAHQRMATPEIGARGMALSRDSNSHVLVVLDGIVMNEQGGGAVFLHDVPLDVVDHIEVILGPGSVLYGAQAMLGVINIVTKRTKDYSGYRGAATISASPPMDSDGALASGRGLSSFGYENRYSAGFGRQLKLFGAPASILGALDYTQFKGPDITFAPQALPGVELGPHGTPGVWGGPVRDQWFHSTAGIYTRVEVTDFVWTTRATVTRLGMPQMDLFENRAPAAYDDPRNANDYELFLTNLRHEQRLTERLGSMVRGYFGYSRRHNSRLVIGHDRRVPGVPLGVIDPEQCPLGASGPCRKEAFFLSRWLGLEAQANYDWLGDGSYKTLIGVDARTRTAAYEFVAFDELSGLSYGSNPALTRWHAGGHDQANEHALGAYLQQTAHPFKALTLNAGVRADFDSRLGSAVHADAISPRAAVIVSFTDNLSGKLIFSKAFRAPSFLEQNIVNGRLLPNPRGLEPETVSSLEAASTLRLGGYSLTLGGFYADWENLIELKIVNAQAPAASRFENVADVRNYGGSLSFDGSLMQSRLRFGVNSMLATAQRQLSSTERARNPGLGASVPMTVAPQLYGNARVSYLFGADTAISGAAGYFGRRIADQAYYGGDRSNLEPRPEAPPQLELRSALTGSFPGVEFVGYTLGGSYALEGREPFVIGPNQGLPRYLSSNDVEPELSLVNRVSVFAGLEFRLEPRSAASAHHTANAGSVTP